ncbi:aldo/keto reductase [Mucilaginibacter ginsenosidivorans]|uniref:Aldo/keto reductase n=1 Tax=Mucilaginibacter ginsenosidivorans TaxID=398053 RepID=A0A5B8UZX7_9SPHI|nr:aldo/keto reductase [Mucilaginibacter ginsenosidivorans]QEC64539.1 aldo/keto reductase [Mucilaginibacter ginsenosidivorans]
MEKRELGRSGIKVHPFCFGGNVFGWTADEKTSFELLDELVDTGFDFIDTADVYSAWAPGNKGGESETIIGNWLKRSGKRDKMIIATKVGKPMGPGKKGLSKTYITRAVEDSLKRLQTDYIDLYQSHDDDKETPLAETLDTFTNLITQGKVRAVGASNYSGARLAEAVEVSRANGLAQYQTLQPEYNLYSREGYEKDLEPVCVKNNIGVITYYSLASGFLTCKYRSGADLAKSQRGGGIKKFMNERGMRILDALDKVAGEYNSTPAAIALAWLIKRPGVVAPIASATSIEQLKQITAAVTTGLSDDAIKLLDTASCY